MRASIANACLGVAGAAQPAVLNLGQVVDAIMIGEGGTVQFYNLSIVNAAPRNIPHTDTHARYRIRTFGPWPSITILPNATVILNDTTNTYDSEPAWSQCSKFQETFRSYASSWMPLQNLVAEGNETLYISGSYIRPVAIRDLLINETVGYARIGTINNRITCQPNEALPAAPAPAPGPALAASGMPASAGQGSSQSRTPAWLIVAIVVPIAVLVTAVAALATLIIRKRQLERRSPAAVDAGLLKVQKSPPTPKSSLQPGTGRSLPRGYSGDVESPHIGPDDGMSTQDEDQLGELPSSRSGQQLNSLLSLPETLRKRSSCMVDNLELGAPLGRGSYGKVYKGKWKGVTVAVKIVEHSAETEGELLQLRESLLSSSIVHPNVVATYKVRTVRVLEESRMTDSANENSGHISKSVHPPAVPNLSTSSGTIGPEVDGGSQDMRETWMLLEYADRGNLDRALVQKKMMTADNCLDLDTVCRCLIDIAAGMDYLHSLGVLHGDLKGANVLLKSSGDDPRGYTCKLADFGLSRVLEAHATHVSTKTYGTLAYMPAELLQDGKMSRAADVYSYSMIMWELFACKRLYEGHIASQVFFKVLMGCRPTIPEHMPKAFQDLMVECWDTDAEKRPTFEEVLKRLQLAQDMQPSLEAALPVAKSTSLGSASVAASEFVPASPGWEERVVSAMNSAQPTRASAMSEAPAWMHQLDSRKPSTDVSNVRTVSSLERMDTGALKDVFGPGSGSTQESPARAAQQAQTISAALVAEMEVHNSRIARQGSGSSSGASMVFLGNQRSKASVARMPPSHGSAAGTPRGGSPTRQSSSWGSAERGSHNERSYPPPAPTRGPAAPEGTSSRAAAMVSPFGDHVNADSEGHLSDASDNGLHVPEVVKQWVTSQRGMSGQRGMSPQGSRHADSRAQGKEDPTEEQEEVSLDEGEKFTSGNFADSVPLESFRGR
ncbi:g10528 [Coccomyxa viridis]|uniref:G10528 protein n=1 Tax=Coccomyxa viridis TaxID=1274662 RepID=A0ABP1G5W9_9CHLO